MFLLALCVSFVAASTTPPRYSQRSRRIAEEVGPRVGQELHQAGLRLGSPVFVRIFKYDSEHLHRFLDEYDNRQGNARDRIMNSQWQTGSTLELWGERSSNTPLVRIAAYPTCKYSGPVGGLGPKKRQGDMLSPEGFYHGTFFFFLCQKNLILLVFGAFYFNLFLL